jgi:hypothetical protein
MHHPSRAAGDWLSGRAPRSHRGGHWFDPSIAHSVRPAQRLLVQVSSYFEGETFGISGRNLGDHLLPASQGRQVVNCRRGCLWDRQPAVDPLADCDLARAGVGPAAFPDPGFLTPSPSQRGALGLEPGLTGVRAGSGGPALGSALAGGNRLPRAGPHDLGDIAVAESQVLAHKGAGNQAC